MLLRRLPAAGWTGGSTLIGYDSSSDEGDVLTRVSLSVQTCGDLCDVVAQGLLFMEVLRVA